MARALRRSLLAAGLVLAASPALAQALDVRTELAGLAADRAALTEGLTLWFGPVPAPQVPLYVDYLAGIIGEPLLADFLVAELPPEAGEGLTAYLGRVGPQVSQFLTVAGFGLLPTDIQTRYLQQGAASVAWVRANQPENCTLFVSEVADAEQMMAMDAQFQATFTLDEVADLLAMNRAALMAVLTNAPPANTFSDAQFEQASIAMDGAFTAALAAAPNADDIALTAMGTPGIDPAAACDLISVTFDAVLSLPQPEQAWAVQLMLLGGG